MMANVKEEKDLDINETIDKVENYWEGNKKSISIILGAIILVVGGYFIYTTMIVAPQEKDAEKDMFFAEQYFGMDSMKLALNGDGNKMGFLQIIENYGSSNSANLAHYYA